MAATAVSRKRLSQNPLKKSAGHPSPKKEKSANKIYYRLVI